MNHLYSRIHQSIVVADFCIKGLWQFGFRPQLYLLLIHEISMSKSPLSIALSHFCDCKYMFCLETHKHPAVQALCNVVGLRGDHVRGSIWKILCTVPLYGIALHKSLYSDTKIRNPHLIKEVTGPRCIQGWYTAISTTMVPARQTGPKYTSKILVLNEKQNK